MNIRFFSRITRIHLPVSALTAACFVSITSAAPAASPARTFPSPEAAVKALVSAVTARDTNAMAAIFGPAFDDVVSPDQVQAQNELTTFADSLTTSNRVHQVQPDRYILESGKDAWPFPIPIVRKSDSAWFFDTDAGKDEIINRRIGLNELDALKTVRAYVDAQRDYAAKDRDGDEVLEYAQKIVSSPGTRDGLFWAPGEDGELSPLGPLVAAAHEEGYSNEKANPDAAPRPFHGYFFKILTRQGKNAPGGQYDYIINGNMIGGFALVAWPAEYGESGIMTFIVNQQGRVYQQDFGEKTESRVKEMKAYDPDKTWVRSSD